MIKSVTILGREVKVQSVSKTRLVEIMVSHGEGFEEAQQTLAWYCGPERTIYVQEGLAIETFQESLQHEVFHAHFDISGLNQLMGEELEEAVCICLESSVSLFKDKKFVEMMSE